MSTTTSGELARAWTERVRSGAFSPAVAGTREVRVFGQAGDDAVTFPQLRALAPGETPELVIELLEPDERWALQHAERVVATHLQAGRLTAEVQRGRADGEVIPAARIDPLKDTHIRTWCASITVGILNGKRRRKFVYGKTRKEVAEKLQALQRQHAAGITFTRLTVKEFLEQLFLSREKGLSRTCREAGRRTYGL